MQSFLRPAVAVLAAVSVGATLAPALAPAAVAARSGPVVVSPSGDDSASGSASAPLRTISAAVRKAPAGGTVLVQGGSYHETVTVPAGHPVSIEAAPGAEVWLDGSRPVRGWERTAQGYVHRDWQVSLDSSPTYTFGESDHTEPGWSFVNDEHPMAAHPDQVFIDGRAQREVAGLAELAPGTFYVDDGNDQLHLGSDPTGREVRASILPRALQLRAEGTTIDGIGVRRYAPSVPHMGAVTVEAPDVKLTGMTIRENATTGVHVGAAGAVVRRVRLVANGMIGMSATYADGIQIINVVSRRNNVERFNTSPVAGGIKVDRTRGVRVVGARITGNAGTGLWFDESARQIRVFHSTVRDNLGHGMSIEISHDARVADTLVAGNAGHGIKVNDTSEVAIWNNTVVGNGRAINIVQDDRRGSDPDAAGHDPRRTSPRLSWITGPVRVSNNILSRGANDANCLLCVEDYSGELTAAEMRVEAVGNVYARTDQQAATWAVVWSRGAGNPAVFTSVSAFSSATGQEQRHLSLVGRRAVTAAGRATPAVRAATARIAVPLPADLAQAVGQPAGVKHLGAWLG